MPTLCNQGTTGTSKERKAFVSRVEKRKACNTGQKKAAEEETMDEDYQSEQEEDSNNDDIENGASNYFPVGCCCFFIHSNPHSCVVYYVGSIPMAMIAVDGDVSYVAHSDDECVDASLSVAGSADNNDACLSTTASMPPLKQIFDCDKLVRGSNAKGPFWECKHFNDVYAGINTTKALCHVLKIKGTHPCDVSPLL